MKIAALIVAAGSGVRAAQERPKQYCDIGGAAILRHTVTAFLKAEAISLIQVVIDPRHDAYYRHAVTGLDIPAPVAGGDSRQDSVRLGLAALSSYSPDIVLIHDAARPFVRQGLIDAVITELGKHNKHNGVIPALAMADTLKTVVGRQVTGGPSRDGLWAAQTPQGFRYTDIKRAHDQAYDQARTGFTDDAALFQWAGGSVHIVDGDPANRKLTTSADIAQADRIMNSQRPQRDETRVGQGFDVHSFGAGDHVMLCGVRIAHTAGLVGHSDADVAMHALTDALLGAMGEGDIGVHFPPSEDKWRGADSAIFLEAARTMIGRRGGTIVHCDVTIICQEPRLRAHYPAMRQRLAEILQIAPGRVSVKATTSERLGFTGRKEGIATLAVATLRLPPED